MRKKAFVVPECCDLPEPAQSGAAIGRWRRLTAGPRRRRLALVPAAALARVTAATRRLRLDWFVLSLVAVVATASLLPCRGAGVPLFRVLSVLAISSLFFLQGARLSRDAVFSGMTHWRLHAAILGGTFVLFPLLGLALVGFIGSALPPSLRIGLLFVCVLPSTVQSSIALTSIARGNVAGAVCAATGSNLVGMIATPLMVGVMLRVHGADTDLAAVSRILLELLLPFVAGHLLRPWIGEWADCNRGVLAITDRSAILLVVYIAFSAAVMHGIWHRLPLPTLAIVTLIDALLLATALAAMRLGSRLSGMPHADEITIVFCGSQKSLVTGVPMANVLFAGSVAGVILLPMMIYYQMQLIVGAWLARRYARAGGAAPAAAGPPLAAGHARATEG
jgi:solute carrier family 10 (sodium/bile acid cotransporter), member 7